MARWYTDPRVRRNMACMHIRGIRAGAFYISAAGNMDGRECTLAFSAILFLFFFLLARYPLLFDGKLLRGRNRIICMLVVRSIHICEGCLYMMRVQRLWVFFDVICGGGCVCPLDSSV